MKYLLIFLALSLCSIGYPQDTIQISETELEEFFLALDTLRTQDSLKTILINELEYEIILHERLARQDSLIILYKDQEIDLLNEQIQLHLDYIDRSDKWYRKPGIGVVGGFVGTLVLIHTIGYILP